MEALLVKTNRSNTIGAGNFAAFNRFRDRLLLPTRLDNGHLHVCVKITCYGFNGLYSYAGKILLINHGVNVGRIWIEDGEEGFSEENYLLGSKDRKYFLGRSGRELVIETSDLESVVRRIDLEEILK